MLRSMSTAVTALNNYQTYLDVISSNLANSTTTAYKASRVLFQDQFSQLISAGSSPTNTSGGINPSQVGLGSKIGSITYDFSQGTISSTGDTLDLAIEGNGFFVYDEGLSRVYSRDGALSLDSEGSLVNASSGLKIQGWSVDENGEINTSLPTSTITIDTSSAKAQATQNVILGGNLDSSTAVNGTLDITMGVYDSLGVLHEVTIEFERTGDDTWSYSVTDPSTATGEGTITFTEGQDPVVAVTTAFTVEGSDGAEATVSMDLDMSDLTMLSMDTDVAVDSQDGLSAGTVSDLAISNGSIYLVYSNGITEYVAELAIANFANTSGLISAGNSGYQQGLNSGEATLSTAGTGGAGKISSGCLESSNVDMAQEFTNMIIAERGFQAASRVITTSDEILQELVNLKR